MQPASPPMLSIDPAALAPRDAYRLMISLIVPRPIAWVSTLGTDGSVNLAPFSFFNGVADSPLTVMISVGQRKGRPKDTLRNVSETGEFVINLADEDLLKALNQTSGDYPYGHSEFDPAGVTMAASEVVRPPRVAEAPLAIEARLSQLVPVEQSNYTMILGRVQRFHIREGLLRPNGLVDAALLRPVARLGGDEYATLGTVLELLRPKIV
jgi:flavin reductase (DIM6/NTAB) family NADH-FMN oxidoreductase RutF